MKTKIHINQHRIKANRKSGATDPVITCKTYKDNRYGSEVDICDSDGKCVAKVIYRPDAPLSCGAHVWVETDHEVIVR